MNKTLLHQTILSVLEQQLEVAKKAALQAYQTATDSENIAENKYDTLGLEAAYLAEGQSGCVAECEQAIVRFKALTPVEYSDAMAIGLGALVHLIDDNNEPQHLFLSPVAGGTRFEFGGRSMLLLTPSAPLGQALLGKYPEDDIALALQGKPCRYFIAKSQ